MTSLVDYSEEPRFTIKNVSNQTGINPVTLRAWENRYQVLTPHRSDNRYRLYSERDVALLRWLKSQVDNGVSISSAVAGYRQLGLTGELPDVGLPVRLPITDKIADTPSNYSHRLFQALIKHNETLAEEIYREFNRALELKTILMDIITPTLVEIGEAWYFGRIQVSTEHFASTFLRGKLLTLLQSYPLRRTAPVILIAGAPGEQHEIAPLMMAILLRSEGYRVEFLGPDIPLEDMVDYAADEKPALIILSATLEESALELRRMQTKLKRLKPMPVFAYGGRAFSLKPELVSQVPGVFLGKSMDAALERVKELLFSALDSVSNG